MDQKKLGQGKHSWLWAKLVWLYSDLLQALNAEHLSTVGSQQRGPNFYVGKDTETVVLKEGWSRLQGPMSVCWSPPPFHTHTHRLALGSGVDST